ncbi:MAG: CoA transferase [SAR92 clade bacterium]|uniref:CoA transferase n=1 Tax=SAR92 clade bacterium TaxID=2315479 RepID=A0A520MD73_9GAMM|nr:MAG: CoA transferase [SAR92 clade bacterium]
MAGPLKGYRVLDMSRVLAGPWAGQLLADLGAEVLKIERPEVGDDTRHWGPPYRKDKQGKDTEDAAYFFCANRGKKSVTVDITQPDGQEIIRQLVLQTDVLIENYKVGGLAKYGLDFDSLTAINPKLVYCSITGFGQTGPYANRPGYDFLIQGLGGLMSITGEPDNPDTKTGGPVKVGVAVTDLFTGLYAANAIQGALLERHQSGLGQHIDLALLDVQAAVLANQASNYLIGGTVPGRLGNAHPNIVPYQAFATADSFIIITVGNDQQFARFCKVINSASLAKDDRYKTNANRVNNRQSLCEKIQTQLKLHDSQHWLEAFEENNVPCGPINAIDQVFEDPQIISRHMLVNIPDSRSGTLNFVGNPIKYSRSDIEYNLSPQELGKQTDSVLTDYLEYTELEIHSLKQNKIV